MLFRSPAICVASSAEEESQPPVKDCENYNETIGKCVVGFYEKCSESDSWSNTYQCGSGVGSSCVGGRCGCAGELIVDPV